MARDKTGSLLINILTPNILNQLTLNARKYRKETEKPIHFFGLSSICYHLFGAAWLEQNPSPEVNWS